MVINMNFRLATKSDLQQLKTVYKKIIEDMNRNNIHIWNEIYPSEFFEDDIKNENLYLLTKDDEIVAAFALHESNVERENVKWKDEKGRAVYISRLGINVDYAKKGIGSEMLKIAMKLAKRRDAQYLRLFVVDINKPAINMYLKNGFTQVDGTNIEKIGKFLLCEYGFEIEV